MMGFIFARMIVTLLVGVAGGAGVLILLGIGQKQEAVQFGIIAAIIVWLVQPCAEDRADFAQFQKSRERFPPI